MKRTQIYISEDKDTVLREVANTQGRSKSSVIRDAIDFYLSDPENFDHKSVRTAVHGLWQQRSNLPDFTSIRKSIDRVSSEADAK